MSASDINARHFVRLIDCRHETIACVPAAANHTVLIFSKKLLTAATAAFIATCITTANAQNAPSPRQQACLGNFEDQTAALATDDWPSLETLAKGYIRDCRGVLDADLMFDSAVFKNLAIANNSQRKWTQALAACSECLKIRYSYSGCHVQRVSALIGTEQFVEAAEAISTARKLIDHRLENYQRELKQPLPPAERDLLLSRVEELEADKRLTAIQQELVEELRKQQAFLERALGDRKR